MNEEDREPWERDEEELNDDVRFWEEAAEPFGDSDPGPRYRCPEHGLIYAGDVRWGLDGRPYCPKGDCDSLLERVDDGIVEV